MTLFWLDNFLDTMSNNTELNTQDLFQLFDGHACEIAGLS